MPFSREQLRPGKFVTVGVGRYAGKSGTIVGRRNSTLTVISLAGFEENDPKARVTTDQLTPLDELPANTKLSHPCAASSASRECTCFLNGSVEGHREVIVRKGLHRGWSGVTTGSVVSGTLQVALVNVANLVRVKTGSASDAGTILFFNRSGPADAPDVDTAGLAGSDGTELTCSGCSRLPRSVPTSPATKSPANRVSDRNSEHHGSSREREDPRRHPDTRVESSLHANSGLPAALIAHPCTVT